MAFKIRQNVFSADPAGGSHDAHSDPLVGWEGDTSPRISLMCSVFLSCIVESVGMAPDLRDLCYVTCEIEHRNNFIIISK